jgi:hypothetical protein
LPLSYNDVITKNFSAIYAKVKSGGNPLRIHFLEITLQTFFGENPLVDGILGHNLLLSQAFSGGIPSWLGFEATTCCLRPFLVGIPSWMEFSRPQLVVVSGLFLYDGIPAIKKPFSRTLFSFFTMEFWLSRSLSHELSFFFHDGILAIMKPFSRTFFFTMEFWQS